VKKAFIDLEETVIGSINSTKVLIHRTEMIGQFLDANQIPGPVGTFSFGLWDDNDFRRWEACKPGVESLLGRQITTQEKTCNQLKKNFLNLTVGHVEEHELIDFVGITTKEMVFERFIKDVGVAGEFWLLDDTVDSKTVSFHDLNIVIHFVNVKKW
jgi:hypothetical protein